MKILKVILVHLGLFEIYLSLFELIIANLFPFGLLLAHLQLL